MSRGRRGRNSSRNSAPEIENVFTLRLVRHDNGKVHAAVRKRETVCGFYNPAWKSYSEEEKERMSSAPKAWRLIDEDEEPDAEVTCGQCLGIIDAICDAFADDEDVLQSRQHLHATG